MKKMSAVIVVAWMLALCGSSLADPPSFTKIFRRKPAEPMNVQALRLQPEHGPWMILACTFNGEEGQQHAVDLANELRTTYRLKAYIHPKTFDYSEKVTGANLNLRGQPKKMKHINDNAIDYYTVMVGDFTSAENPAYEEALKIIKFARPKTLGGDGSNPGASLKGSWSELKGLVIKKKDDPNLQRGPMKGAFGTGNPLLPEDFTQPPKVDKFVKQLNSEVEHSLLENPKRFTVRIATFKGLDIVVAKKTDDIKTESESGTPLERAAIHADTACRLLRSQGIEAYQFHDRNSSIVTVGGFDSIGGNDAEGNFAYDPGIVQTMQTYGGAKNFQGSEYGQLPVAKTLLDVVNYRNVPELTKGSDAEKKKWVNTYSVPLDLNPTVMAVPRPEVKSLYSGSLLGKH